MKEKYRAKDYLLMQQVMLLDSLLVFFFKILSTRNIYTNCIDEVKRSLGARCRYCPSFFRARFHSESVAISPHGVRGNVLVCDIYCILWANSLSSVRIQFRMPSSIGRLTVQCSCKQLENVPFIASGGSRITSGLLSRR